MYHYGRRNKKILVKMIGGFLAIISVMVISLKVFNTFAFNKARKATAAKSN